MKLMLLKKLFSLIVPTSNRGRAVLVNTAAAFMGRLFTIVCNLAQVPIAFKYLGKSEFGIWVTLNSAIGLMTIADFGIGFGIQNTVSEAFGRDDRETISRTVIRGLLLLTIIALGVGLIAYPIIEYSNWTGKFTSDLVETEEIRSAAVALLLIFCLNLPCSAFQRTISGLQIGWVGSSSALATNYLALLLIWIGSKEHFRFSTFVLAAAVPTLLNSLVMGVYLFLSGKISIQFRFLNERLELYRLFRLGVPFVVPQLAATALILAPPVAIGSILGPESAGIYNICQRMLSLFAQLQALLINILWPAFTEARARQDFQWLTKSFKFLCVITLLLFALPQAIFPLWGNAVGKLWIGKVAIDFVFLAFLGSQGAVNALCQPASVLLNSMNRAKGQTIYVGISSLFCISFLPFALSKYGLSGAPISYLLFFTTIALPCLLIESKRALDGVQRHVVN